MKRSLSFKEAALSPSWRPRRAFSVDLHKGSKHSLALDKKIRINCLRGNEHPKILFIDLR
jgi:hypothetical protein